MVVGDSAQAEILGRMAMLAWTKLQRPGPRGRAAQARARPARRGPRGAQRARQHLRAAGELDRPGRRARARGRRSATTTRCACASTPTSAASGTRSCTATATRSRAGSACSTSTPAHTDALFAMAEIHRAAGSHSDLVDTLHRIIDVGGATLDDAVIEGVYMQLGSIFERQAARSRPRRSRRTAARSSSTRATSPRWTRSSASTRAEGQWEECIDVMMRRADALEDPRQKIQVLLDVAQDVGGEARRAASRRSSRCSRSSRSTGSTSSRSRSSRRCTASRSASASLIELYVSRVEAAPTTSTSACGSCARWRRSTRRTSATRTRRSTRCCSPGRRTSRTKRPRASSSA